MERIRSHRELKAYQTAFEGARLILRLTRKFPADEKYELTKQIRAAARSVCANLAEAWRKRRYAAAFVSKLTDAEAEAAETQVWLEFAFEDGYIAADQYEEAFDTYEKAISQIVLMISDAKKWGISWSHAAH
jgi:four helix bundle protein